MQSLTLEERGAYNTCLDLVYEREGPIPDDARWLAGWMGCSVRKWTALRAALIIKGKIFEIILNGTPSLMNERAVIELENQSERSRVLSENGAKGGRTRAENEAKDNKNNAPEQAPVKLSTVTSTETGTEEPTTINAGDWRRMLDEAKAAAGEAADFTRPAMLHAADLRALVEPRSGEPCTWGEVLDAIAMVALRQTARGKRIETWKWVQSDAWSLRDKRLSADAPAVADVVAARATGPPGSFSDKIAADNAESERRAFEMLDAPNGRTN